MSAHALTVTSHVARDLLQSAALFKHAQHVIWEYVSNGLQYVDPGTQPKVSVHLRNSEISISDNGRGMDLHDLRRFFTMHGENEDRLQGRPGRGMFGTGKSAAFSIADTLRITTVRQGKKSIVELRRRDLESVPGGGEVPVRKLLLEDPANEPNGTLVELRDLKQIRIDRREVTRLLERHLRHWRAVNVEVDGMAIEPSLPPIQRTIEVVASDSDPDCVRGSKLILHVAKAPLPEEDRGVAVLANGVLHTVTLAGAERKEFSSYIFGEIDVPGLSEPFEGVDAYDMSRSGRLNPENRVVIDTLAFIGQHVELVRRELVELDKRRRKQAEAERLQSQADEIAKIINEDYIDFAKRFKPMHSSRSGSTDIRPGFSKTEEGDLALLDGGEVPAVERLGESAPIDDSASAPPEPAPEPPEPEVVLPALEPALTEEATTAASFQTVHSKPRRRTGGFDVRYDYNGCDNPRCLYHRESRTLFINLDHPQLIAAKGEGTTDDLMFRKLSFEVAFTEYAISLSQENVQGGFYQDMFHPLTDARERIDSLARKAAHLFV